MHSQGHVASTESDLLLLVLHGLRLKGSATAALLAQTYGVDQAGVEVVLESCRESGFVGSRPTGDDGPTWYLSPSGRSEGERLVHNELGSLSQFRNTDLRLPLMDLYQRFLPLNRSMLQLCTRWQVRSHDPIELNDHQDSVYDATVVEQLSHIHHQIQPICAELESVLGRFSRYGSGFDYALARIRGGAIEWFTKPTLLSYHTLWFELHEDLLATLELDRATETARHGHH